MNVFAQVIEVQAQGIQLGEVQLHLLANPRCSVHQAHALVGLLEPQPVRFTTQQLPRRHMITMRESHMLMLRILAVKEGDLELLPGQVRASRARWQGLALLAATTTLGFGVVAAFDLLGIGDDRHHHTVAARVNTRFLACFVVGDDAFFRLPRHGDDIVLLGFQHATPSRFDLLPQSLAAELHLCRTLQGRRRSDETRRRQVHAAGHLQNAGRDRDAVAL